MAEKKKRPNRFADNHPPVDPNDPAILITAGLTAPQNVQEPVEEEEVVTTPVETEKPTENAAEAEEKGLDGVFARIKESKKKKSRKESHTMTLSDPVWKELVKRSKKEGMSASAYLDELLKGVFEL